MKLLILSALIALCALPALSNPLPNRTEWKDLNGCIRFIEQTAPTIQFHSGRRSSSGFVDEDVYSLTYDNEQPWYWLEENWYGFYYRANKQKIHYDLDILNRLRERFGAEP